MSVKKDSSNLKKELIMHGNFMAPISERYPVWEHKSTGGFISDISWEIFNKYTDALLLVTDLAFENYVINDNDTITINKDIPNNHIEDYNRMLCEMADIFFKYATGTTYKSWNMYSKIKEPKKVYVVYAVMCKKDNKTSEYYDKYICSDVLEVFKTEEEAIEYLHTIGGAIPLYPKESMRFFIRDLGLKENERIAYFICEKEL